MNDHRAQMETNRRSWDQRVPIHLRSATYSAHLVALRRGEDCLDPLSRIILEEVGDVTGKSLLHLQCHIGHDTLSWARRGAKVTGLDFSPPAINTARELAEELGIDARFVCANVYDAAEAIDERFDIVFASLGVFCWIPDVRRWMTVAAAMLKPGGMLYIMDGHPFADMLDDRPDAPDGITIADDYFYRGPYHEAPGPSYAVDPAAPDQVCGETVEWTHTVGDFVNAVIGADLQLECLHEHPLSTYRKFKAMVPGEADRWHLPGELRDKVPMLMSIRATKA